jgi:hypothetical protein
MCVGFLIRLIRVDHTAGRIVVPPRTFEGAHLSLTGKEREAALSGQHSHPLEDERKR